MQPALPDGGPHRWPREYQVRTMHEGTTEERFEAAARNLCERWESFDFVRHVQSGDSDPEWVPSEFLSREIDDIGAVPAIKRRLHIIQNRKAMRYSIWLPLTGSI
jgi:hypothetical protein